MSEPPPLHLSDFHKKMDKKRFGNRNSFLKSEDPFQALIKQQAYFQEIQAKQQMEFQKQMMEFLKSKRIHE